MKMGYILGNYLGKHYHASCSAVQTSSQWDVQVWRLTHTTTYYRELCQTASQ